MAQHEQIHRERQKHQEEENTRKRRQPPQSEQFKAPDEGFTDSLAEPSLEHHATLLANAPSDRQRASLVIQMQQLYGNAYVQRLLESKTVQAKLTVNPPDDEYEREADRVAEAVTQTAASQLQRQEIPEEEELQMKSAAELQRQEMPEEEEELLQAEAVDSQPMAVSDDLERQIELAQGGGQPLADSVRASVEPVFGHDFSQVRIHTDIGANQLSRQLGAEAFTTGKDIFFRDGAYQPDTDNGKGLIAHELTHVVQQSEVPSSLQRDAAEEEEEEEERAAEAEAEQEAAEGPAPAAPSTEVTSQTETTAATAEESVLTAAQASLWRTLVVTPLNEVFGQLNTESPNWQSMADTLNTVHQSMGSFGEAVSLPEAAQSSVEGIRANVFDCYLMAESHASGGEMFGSNLRVAIDSATRIGGGG